MATSDQAVRRTACDALQELEAVLTDQDFPEDPMGMLRVWAEVALGMRQPLPDAALTPDQRRDVALNLARERGRVTSGELAQATGTSTETARQDLHELAEQGRLERRGRWRHTRYLVCQW